MPCTPSGKVKDSDVRCVRAHHQIGLTHTEKCRVSFSLGEGQQLLHCSLKKKKKPTHHEMSNVRPVTIRKKKKGTSQHEPAVCESEPCSVPQCRGSRHVPPQCVSHKETSLESQRVWRIRRGFGSATGMKLAKCP